MLRIATTVTATPTGSDLEARLEEADRIIRLRPPYNKALKRRGSGFYLELRWGEPFPRLRLVRHPRRTGARYVGPFWGRRTPEKVKRLVEKIVRLRSCFEPVRPDQSAAPCIQFDLGLCTAPCARRVGIDRYRTQAEAAEKLLTDGAYSWDLHDRVSRSRDIASKNLDFEKAAVHQARLDWLEELEQFRFALEDDGGDRSWLIALPGADDHTRILQPVALGRVLRRRIVVWGEGWPDAVEDACYAIRVAELRAPAVLSPQESVPSLMIKRWIEEGSPDGIAVDLTKSGVEEAIRSLDASLN
jgi:excinuclease UvrABC nuclease subunit